MRNVYVHATFSAVALEEGLAWWIRHLWPDCDLSVGGHDSLFQCVFDPDSNGLRNAAGTLVLALDPGSLDRLDGDGLSLETFREALARLAQRPGLQVVLAILHPAQYHCAAVHAADSTHSEAAQELATVAGVISIDSSHIQRFLSGPVLAPSETAHAAGIPYSRHYLAALATAIAWRLDQVARPLKKVLVLDCDYTLWSGVVAEDGIEGLVIEDRHQKLAHLAGRLREAGWLICLCSKNELQDVRAALDSPDLGLELAWDDLAAVRVNWEDKAGNLQSLAEELEFGLESFVFIDDNPVECANVQALLPEVSVLHVNPDSDYRWLERVWLFDVRNTTREDAQRAEFYARNVQRETLRKTLTSARDFIEALEIELSVKHASVDDAPRIEQLSLRTNQFNFSGLKLQQPNIDERIASDEKVVVCAHLRDRFGDYGLVGVATAQWDDDCLAIDGFWLSCRALGRGVEHAMVRNLGATAKSRGCATLAFELKELPRNLPARRFAATMAASADSHKAAVEVNRQAPSGTESLPGDGVLQISVSAAEKLDFDPDQSTDPQAKDASKPVASSAPQHSSDYGLIARCAMDRDLLQAIEGAVVRRRGLQRTYVAPRTSLERSLARIWATTLSMDAVGINDEFEELGGRSIQLVTIHARICDRLGCSLEFVDLFRFTTISALAGHLEGRTSGRSMDGVVERSERQRRAIVGFRRIDRSGFRV